MLDADYSRPLIVLYIAFGPYESYVCAPSHTLAAWALLRQQYGNLAYTSSVDLLPWKLVAIRPVQSSM